MKKKLTKLLSCTLLLLIVVSSLPIPTFAIVENMSEEFKSILNKDGKFVMNAVKPESEDEAYWLFNETEYMNETYPDFSFDSFSNDYQTCEISYKYDYTTQTVQEKHVVEIIYNYDKTVKSMVDGMVSKFPAGEEFDGYYFAVKDMELLSWWVNSGDINTMIDYSGELKSYMNYKNFQIDCRKGNDEAFVTEASGVAPFIYDSITYKLVTMGVRGKHIIYVPDETAATKEALMTAAQKRVDEYIGEGKAKVSYGGQGIRKYYDDLLSEKIDNYTELLKQCESKIEEYERLLESDPENYDYQTEMRQLTLNKMQYEMELENAKNYKTDVLDAYDNEGGKYYFLQSAAGDYWFNLEIGDESYMFIVVADSDGMVNPKYKSSDVATDVTVESTDSSVPLDTRISVNELKTGSKYEEIVSFLNVEDNQTYDINLFSNSLDKYITKLADGKFIVNIPVSTEFKDKNLIAYYVDENKDIHRYEVTVKDGYASFVTDHFSIYTLAEKKSIEVNDGKAEISDETVKEAIADAGTSDMVEIVLDNVVEEVTNMQLPVDSLRAVAEADKGLSLKILKVTVTLDKKVLEKIVNVAGANENVEIKINEINKETLTSKQQEAIKDKEVAGVISAEIICNNTTISDFSGGRVKLQIPFTPAEGSKGSDYKVLYVADDGMIEEIVTTYKDGCIVVELEHFSKYVIVKSDSSSVDTGDSGNIWLWSVCLCVSAMAIGGICILLRTKNESRKRI
ncbi:MAG: hypothetical protein ACI4D4_11185 [Lachnospira sp.]